MIELGKLSVKNANTRVEVLKKIRSLVEELGYDSIHATRIEAIVSEICRLGSDSEAVNISVAIDNMGGRNGLSMTFLSRGAATRLPVCRFRSDVPSGRLGSASSTSRF